MPDLSQDIFDSMATSCADDGTCGISEQNFVDFIYGQIEANGITVTPEYVLLSPLTTLFRLDRLTRVAAPSRS